MLICLNCRNHKSRVLETRTAASINGIRRRRACLECGKAFSTLEVPVPEGLNLRLVTAAIAKLEKERK